YKSTINGHVALNGRGTTLETLDVNASGNLEKSTILGGRIEQVAFDASIANNVAHVKANGSIADLDPSVATGQALYKGSVGGTFDVDTTLEDVSEGVQPDRVHADFTVSLQPTTLRELGASGGLHLSKADLEGSYQNSVADIRRLDVVGHNIYLSAYGRLSLDEQDDSNLTVHAESPGLDQIGKLAGSAAEPLEGIAKIDVTVTGNRRELQASGHLAGDGLAYGKNGALAVTSDFSAKVPELSLSEATMTADTHATFVTLAGLNIDEL